MSAALALDAKRFATLQARTAMLGGELYRTTDDAGRERFIVSKWALTKTLDTPEMVEAWIKQLGGPDA